MPKMLVNGKELSFRFALFDLDGTLVDDEDRYRNLAAFRYTAIEARAGRKAADIWAPLGGYDPAHDAIDMSGPIAKAARREDMALAAASIYLTGCGWHEARALAEEAYADADAAQLRNYTPRLFPGVEESLRHLKGAGFKLGIATNGLSKITSELLQALNLSKLFSVVAGSEDAENPKPAPDLLLAACKKAKVAPSKTVYIGDQPVDAAAAEAAGFMAAVIVGKASVRESPKVHRVASVIDIVLTRES